jgi:hypothetical protein
MTETATRKIVINTCYGVFGLSIEAEKMLAKKKGFDSRSEWNRSHRSSDLCEFRDDPDLIEIVETMGDASYSPCAKLSIVTIPADVEWQIEDYDGAEWVAEKHRTWHGE